MGVGLPAYPPGVAQVPAPAMAGILNPVHLPQLNERDSSTAL
jgi:hypothetical protein